MIKNDKQKAPNKLGFFFREKERIINQVD